MNTLKNIALIAVVSFFASCSKNEVVEPAMPTEVAASEVNDNAQTTPLLDSGAEVDGNTSDTHTTPLLDADTPTGPVQTGDPAQSELQIGDLPVSNKLSYTHNLEVQ